MILELKLNSDWFNLPPKPRGNNIHSLISKPHTPEYNKFGKKPNDLWRDAWEHGLRFYKDGDPWEDPQWHSKMVEMLKKIGLDEEANELEIIRPDERDINIGNSTSPVSTHDKESFKAAHRSYMDNVEHILNLLGKIGQSEGWLER